MSEMNRRDFIRLGAAAAAGTAFGGPAMAEADKRPNILFVTVDDMNFDTPGCFGGTVENVTPNIDRLASEGMRFTHAHVTVAVCQPSRQTLMTGRYPHRFGALGFSPIDPSITTLQEKLSEAGYVNGIMGKVHHLSPLEKFSWNFVKRHMELGQGRDPQLYYQNAKFFMTEAARHGKPFFLMANSHDPHRPFHGSEDEQRRLADYLDELKTPSRVYSPDEVNVPGFLPELPAIRGEAAEYYSSARRADDTVGEVLRALRDSGQEDNTLVMFLSDNGMAFASAKWNCYLQSTQTPWIVRWPGKVEPNTVDAEHFISGIDFTPTILDVAGIEPPDGLNGKSFLPLLLGSEQSGRDYVITAHYQAINYYGDKEKRKKTLDKMRAEGWWDWEECHGLFKNYPIRCIQNERYGYMYNQWSDGTNEYLLGGGETAGALSKAAETDPAIKQRVDMILRRVPEEFYDFAEDPHSLNNLIDDPKHKKRVDEMRERLLAWMIETGDPVLPAFREQIGAGAM